MAAPAADASKSSKRRKAKSTDPTTETASHASDPAPSAPAVNGTDTPTESPYVRELTKQLRNANKKLTGIAKTESIKINNDQKAQITNKPNLKAQITQLEEQLSAYKSFGLELEDRHSRDKAALVESHESEIAHLKEEAAASAKAAEGKDLDKALEIVSSFLHAAAAKRGSDDTDSPEALAFEGGLLMIYQGNSASTSALKSLVEGSDEKVLDTHNEPVDFTWSQLKEASLAASAVKLDISEAEPEEAEQVPETDPTIANASLTELEETSAIPLQSATNGQTEPEPAAAVPEQASTGDEAANAVAETAGSWQGDASWVQVPRDPAETDTGLEATPAAPARQSTWLKRSKLLPKSSQ
ncbi:uncharacterized protein AB675_1241 [Cyphellophora attinorum]|uniref:YAG7-like dimerisation domain-containing protein n=1 Tax=Cyphellophora attinorum TaxID=1664694 RepID=A0A0N0NIF6_9EURO|nr:uncharacterized protein AB675_1241 [Phialophora attinorum]KPI35688.1 hypothetical protein AB675_1241 [Phialophora attinorum]